MILLQTFSDLIYISETAGRRKKISPSVFHP